MPLRQPRISLLLLVVLLMQACRQEPTPTPPPAPLLSQKLTAYYYQSAAQPTRADSAQLPSTVYQNITFYVPTRSQDVYQYDAQRRLTYIQTRNPDRPEYTYDWGDVSFEYADHQLFYTNRRVFPLEPASYTLNDQGYITRYNTYDGEGYLIFRQEGPSATVTQTIEGGNIVKHVYQDRTSRTTTTYEYDLTKPGLPNPTQVLWGRPSRNLVSKMTEVYEYLGGVSSIWPDQRVTTYSYVFAADGRVSQQTAYTQSTRRPSPVVLARELRVSTLTFE